MRIREIRIQKGLQLEEVIVKLRDVDSRVNHVVYGILEEGVCLPTIPVFKALCRVFHVKKNTLATREETQFNVRSIKRHKENRDLYQIHGRVPRLLIGTTDDLHIKLKACGYNTVTNWLLCCLVELNAKYEKSRRDVGASSAAQENKLNRI